MLEMKRIAVPSWAPSYSKHVVQHGQCVGDTQKEAISKLLPEIYEALGKLINDFANDPDQCFLSDSYFPVKERLSGEYYITSESYFMSKTDGQVILSLMVSCLEKQWHMSQEKDGTDYLGLEAFVTIDNRRQKFVFDDGFNTSSI